MFVYKREGKRESIHWISDDAPLRKLIFGVRQYNFVFITRHRIFFPSRFSRWNGTHHNWTLSGIWPTTKNGSPKNLVCVCVFGREQLAHAHIWKFWSGSIVYFIIRKILIECQTFFCVRFHNHRPKTLIKRKLVWLCAYKQIKKNVYAKE